MQAKNDSNGWREVGDCQDVTLKQPNLTTYKLESLQPNTYYRIELRARNVIGFSSPNQVIVKTARGSKYGANTFFLVLLMYII